MSTNKISSTFFKVKSTRSAWYRDWVYRLTVRVLLTSCFERDRAPYGSTSRPRLVVFQLQNCPSFLLNCQLIKFWNLLFMHMYWIEYCDIYIIKPPLMNFTSLLLSALQNMKFEMLIQNVNWLYWDGNLDKEQ